MPDDKRRKRQGKEHPCPSVYPPYSALGSLPSVALSSEQVLKTYHNGCAAAIGNLILWHRKSSEIRLIYGKIGTGKYALTN
jgi:hypothetical protein